MGNFETIEQRSTRLGVEIEVATMRAIQATADGCVPIESLDEAMNVGVELTEAIWSAMDWDAVDVPGTYIVAKMQVRGEPRICALVEEPTSGATFLLRCTNPETKQSFVPSVVWAAAIDASTDKAGVFALLGMPRESCDHFGVPYYEQNSELPA
jgi:hypothetical protein